MKRDESQFEWRELAEEWRHKHAPPAGLESRLLAEFRTRKPKSARNIRTWWMAAAAAITLITLIAGASIWNNNQPQKPAVVFDRPEPLRPAPKPAPAPSQLANAITPQPIGNRRTPKRFKPPVREVVPVTSASTQEVYTEFFPLEEGPISIDRGSVVRVRVPRSAMFRVGLPVNMNRLNDSIQADLVLSEDGIARAVRFVQ